LSSWNGQRALPCLSTVICSLSATSRIVSCCFSADISMVADALEVSIDFMIGKTSLEIDNGTLKRLEELSKLPEEAKKQVFLVVDALIRDFKAKQAYS
jgi:uracil phosphoribosyltransferase